MRVGRYWTSMMSIREIDDATALGVPRRLFYRTGQANCP